MNFLKGRIRGDGQATFVGEGGLEIPLATAPAASDGRAVTLGIRPEHLKVSADGFAAQVVVVEPTGSETMLAVRAGGADLTCVLRERLLPKPGETLHLQAEPGLVHLFDGETGLRL
jgi:multiple sugar transport system ATP-binding protein